jgi:hypothetical protein
MGRCELKAVETGESSQGTKVIDMLRSYGHDASRSAPWSLCLESEG